MGWRYDIRQTPWGEVVESMTYERRLSIDEMRYLVEYARARWEDDNAWGVTADGEPWGVGITVTEEPNLATP